MKLKVVFIALCLALFSCNPAFSPTRLMNKLAPDIVMLTPTTTNQTGATGFEVLTPTGHLFTITNAHVCRIPDIKDNLMAARRANDDRAYTIRILEISQATDLCLLEPIPRATGLKLAQRVEQYEELYVFGHPLLKRLMPSEGWLIGREIIMIYSPLNEKGECPRPDDARVDVESLFGPITLCTEKFDSYHVSVQIYPGNSGSPLVNSRGQVVGVIFAADPRMADGFAVPLNDLVEFLSNY